MRQLTFVPFSRFLLMFGRLNHHGRRRRRRLQFPDASGVQDKNWLRRTDRQTDGRWQEEWPASGAGDECVFAWRRNVQWFCALAF